jgi:hypothetical protein
LANLDHVLVRYRQHPESLTHSHLESSCRWTATAIGQAPARRGLEPREIKPGEPRPRTGISELMFRAMRAHRSGLSRTARKYALRSLAHAPFNLTAWRVALVVALRRTGADDPTLHGALRDKPNAAPHGAVGRRKQAALDSAGVGDHHPR